MNNELIKRIDEVLDATFKSIPVDTRDLLEDCRAEIELLSQVNEGLRNQNTALDEKLAEIEAAGEPVEPVVVQVNGHVFHRDGKQFIQFEQKPPSVDALIGVDDWIEAKPILFPATESLIAEAVAKEREACAQLCEPKSKRPCDCESCYCQNSGDLADVTSWDDATRLAKAIRARGQK